MVLDLDPDKPDIPALARIALWVGVSMWWAVALGLMLAGAVGNLLDRIFREPGFLQGHVVDFLRLPNWPVFNVADMSLVTAAVMIVGLSLLNVPYDRPRHSPADANAA